MAEPQGLLAGRWDKNECAQQNETISKEFIHARQKRKKYIYMKMEIDESMGEVSLILTYDVLQLSGRHEICHHFVQGLVAGFAQVSVLCNLKLKGIKVSSDLTSGGYTILVKPGRGVVSGWL